MKKIIFLFLIATFGIYSASNMRQSSYDKRIGSVDYNQDDVISVYAKEGYFTMIEFDKDEQIKDAHAGFDGGWVIKKSGNTAYIMPTRYISTLAKAKEKGGDKIIPMQMVIQPNIKDWATNLFIRTNKKIYIFDLHLSLKNPNYKIKIKYGKKEDKEKIVKQKEVRKKRKKAAIKKALNRVEVPRNWDYYKKVNKGSKRLTPNYVYDDGKFTYFGFDRTKIMPAIFIREQGKEYSVNAHVRKRGKYYVKIVHKTGKLFFLRSGRKLVGVLNGGYNKNPLLEYTTTSNKKIKRVIK